MVAILDVTYSDVHMVRKQLYISDEQEQLLKRRAHELGTTEAELMRRALDLLLHDDVPTMPIPQQLAAFEAFQATADIIESPVNAGETSRWCREDAYDDERQARHFG